MSNDSKTSNLIQLSGLWLNESSNGDTYMNGYLGSARLLVFKNKHKTEDKHPDYVLYVTANNRQSNSDDSEDIPHPF